MSSLNLSFKATVSTAYNDTSLKVYIRSYIPHLASSGFDRRIRGKTGESSLTHFYCVHIRTKLELLDKYLENHGTNERSLRQLIVIIQATKVYV